MADVMNVALKYCNMQSDINYGQAFGGPSPSEVCHRTSTVEHVDCSDFTGSVGSSCPAVVERQLLTASRVEKTKHIRLSDCTTMLCRYSCRLGVSLPLPKNSRRKTRPHVAIYTCTVAWLPDSLDWKQMAAFHLDHLTDDHICGTKSHST